MRKYITLFFSVFPFLFACNSGRTPGDIIPKDEMINLLTEVHIADGRLVNLSQAPDTLYKYGTARYLAIFKKFHTDSTQFLESYRYYSKQPDDFVDMYDKVLKVLQVKSDSLNKLLVKENMARMKRGVKPGINNPNSRYGVGFQPQVPLPVRNGPRSGLTPKQRYQQHMDSLNNHQKPAE